MSFLDSLKDQVLGGLGQHGDAARVAMDLVQQHGGIGGLAQQFHDKGLGGMISAWISNGPNPPISPDQLTQVLGSGKMGEMAQKLGVDPHMAATAIAAVLPTLIDKLTPDGHVPQSGPGAAPITTG